MFQQMASISQRQAGQLQNKVYFTPYELLDLSNLSTLLT